MLVQEPGGLLLELRGGDGGSGRLAEVHAAAVGAGDGGAVAGAALVLAGLDALASLVLLAPASGSHRGDGHGAGRMGLVAHDGGRLTCRGLKILEGFLGPVPPVVGGDDEPALRVTLPRFEDSAVAVVLRRGSPVLPRGRRWRRPRPGRLRPRGP